MCVCFYVCVRVCNFSVCVYTVVLDCPEREYVCGLSVFVIGAPLIKRIMYVVIHSCMYAVL